ncbi:unnamed protein product [Ceutorhynchus assimilis]|uniref:Helitron helicase-like domain-containing protein n=1 Tax=Ceutorhynchus assimilis TaxID=467358 RepID=A0A9N9N233_9CUCU|nr:unnamed protein product [Ceutorhynchus assimilis]
MQKLLNNAKIRLNNMRLHATQIRVAENSEERDIRLNSMRLHATQVRAAERPEQREIRLENMRLHATQVRALENTEQRDTRLKSMRSHASQVRAAETPAERVARTQNMRVYSSQSRRAHRANIETFQKTINTFCDRICMICTKRCYTNQVTNYKVHIIKAAYLPQELACKTTLLLCHRCNKHVTSNNNTPPSKAYWNNLDPGIIPEVINQPEQRLLSRIIPFTKVVKFDGTFGQYGFRGQAVLFAQDIFEVTEKLPNMLPRSTDSIGMIVVSEHLQNLNITREFPVSRTRVYEALQWLVTNNPLYKDVVVDSGVQLQEQDLIRIVPPKVNDTRRIEGQTETEHIRDTAFVAISASSRILRASWHQGNEQIFHLYPGMQCCAMVIANIVRAAFVDPNSWTNNILNENMLEGDNMYATIRRLSMNNVQAPPIDETGYLEIRHLDVIKNRFKMYDRHFSIQYDEDTNFYGSLQDSANVDGVGMTLRNALNNMFSEYTAGALITGSYTFGVMNIANKYYFTNSHSCGPKGASASRDNGRARVIQCDTLDELIRRSSLFSSGSTRAVTNGSAANNVNASMNEAARLDSSTTTQPVIDQNSNKCSNKEGVGPNTVSGFSDHLENIPVQSSLLAPIDTIQPVEEEELDISTDLNKISRKTKDNIVNEAHERKVEEFSWFFLFPYGINGLNEARPVKITPLDYFQFRILGQDSRFQRNDYLFYALSMYEYYRLKSTIAACCKKVKCQDGKVEDVHLYLRNLRGSSAYWKTALNELLAQIRCLGPPTYFLTFSCNDVNWPDMRKALLIADGRPNDNPDDLNLIQAQRLIENYPAIVSRHFMIRVNALMRFLRSDNEVLGGPLKDFWWRIEFQNRGSPHLHMLTWIDGHPSFDTEEGLRILDQVCKCEMPPQNSDLYELVKKYQVHRHSHTCYKKDDTSTCRFGFPRAACDETRIVAHSSEEFIRNGGRMCLLKRRPEEKWVNNYSATLLKIWQGNHDIQPCGSSE